MSSLRYAESVVIQRSPEDLWGYAFARADGGTRVTESWEFLPDGIARFRERFGPDAEAQIASRTEAARHGIPVTLAALKKAAEAG